MPDPTPDRTQQQKLISALLTDWSLRTDGAPVYGRLAIVQPVITDDGRRAVVKISAPLPATEHEHLALRRWAGAGAVWLYSADPRRSALLIERADPGRTPGNLDPVEACSQIAALYSRLHVPAIPQLALLSERCARWAEQLRRLHDHPAVPRRLVDHAASLAADFATDPGTDGRLIHTDLHFGNVLGSARAEEPTWLAIAPKPLSGDPHFEVAPLLEHRWQEISGSGNVRHALLDRVYAAVDTAELDEDRARDWIIVREVVAIMQALVDRQVAADDDRVTAGIVIAKSAQR